MQSAQRRTTTFFYLNACQIKSVKYFNTKVLQSVEHSYRHISAKFLSNLGVLPKVTFRLLTLPSNYEQNVTNSNVIDVIEGSCSKWTFALASRFARNLVEMCENGCFPDYKNLDTKICKIFYLASVELEKRSYTSLFTLHLRVALDERG